MNNQKEGQYQIKHILRNMRKKQNKTIEQIAEELDVSRQTISNWESGKNTPDAISFLKLVNSYEPSFLDVKQLLGSVDETTEHNGMDDWGKNYCDLYEKTNSTFFDKTGPASFFIDDFLAFVRKEVGKYLEESNQRIIIGEDKEKNKNALLALLFATPPSKSESDIDYGLIMIELAMRLRSKGYIVNEADGMGHIKLIILDENQRKRLDSLILEHIFVSSTRLEGLSGAERFLLKGIQTEYDQINQKIKDLKENKLDAIVQENGFGWTKEYVLSIGELAKDANVYTESSTMIHTTDTLEEMADYLETMDERIKKLVDNKKTFFVLSDNHDNGCCFNPKGEPNIIGDVKLYRVDCYDNDEQQKENGHE